MEYVTKNHFMGYTSNHNSDTKEKKKETKMKQKTDQYEIIFPIKKVTEDDEFVYIHFEVEEEEKDLEKK